MARAASQHTTDSFPSSKCPPYPSRRRPAPLLRPSSALSPPVATCRAPPSTRPSLPQRWKRSLGGCAASTAALRSRRWCHTDIATARRLPSFALSATRMTTTRARCRLVGRTEQAPSDGARRSGRAPRARSHRRMGTHGGSASPTRTASTAQCQRCHPETCSCTLATSR